MLVLFLRVGGFYVQIRGKSVHRALSMPLPILGYKASKIENLKVRIASNALFVLSKDDSLESWRMQIPKEQDLVKKQQ